MNLTTLFEAQKQLRQHIFEKHPELKDQDLLPNLILAFNVEVAECAQEQRSWKYWSNDREPRTSKKKNRPASAMEVDKNPLLEEYVDALHFLLEIGIELEVVDSFGIDKEYWTEENVVDQFRAVMWMSLEEIPVEPTAWYDRLVSGFAALGEMLGFSWEQIEQAYLAKNAVNHQRQEAGY